MISCNTVHRSCNGFAVEWKRRKYAVDTACTERWMVPGKSKTKVKMKNCVKLLDDVTLQNPGLRPSMLSVYDRLCNRLCYVIRNEILWPTLNINGFVGFVALHLSYFDVDFEKIRACSLWSPFFESRSSRRFWDILAFRINILMYQGTTNLSSLKNFWSDSCA